MQRHVRDRDSEGNPFLVKSQEGDHDKEMKVQFNVPAGEVNKYRRRTDQSKSNANGLQGGAEKTAIRRKREQRDQGAFKSYMEYRAVFEQSSGTKFPGIAQKGTEQYDGNGVKPSYCSVPFWAIPGNSPEWDRAI